MKIFDHDDDEEEGGHTQEIHVYIHTDSTGLASISDKLDRLLAGQEKEMKELDDLVLQVQATTDAEDSAGVAIKGLTDLIAANAGNPAKLAELTAALKAKTDALAAAVVAIPPA